MPDIETDPIIDRLDQIKGRADVATPGPWTPIWEEGDDWWVIYGAPHYDGGHYLLCPEVAVVEGDSSRSDDAAFIAAAREDVPRIEAALRAVLDLHKPTTMGFIVGDCAAEACDHEDPDDCSTAPQKVCGGCVERAESVTSYAMESPFVVQSVIWPCDHVHAIADALGVETEGGER